MRFSLFFILIFFLGPQLVAQCTIITQPSTAFNDVCLGENFPTLTVVASGGAGLTYQWYSNSINSNVGGVLLNGATGSSYTPSSNTVGSTYYYCIVSEPAPVLCSTSSSVSGLFTVNPAAGAVTVSPLSVTACGSQLLQANIVTNDNIYWQGTTSNGTSTATQLSSQTVNSSGTYYFRAQTALGCWGPQGSATVTINAPVNISLQPTITPQTVCLNGSFSALSVSATGTGLTYQWYSNSINSNVGWTLLIGATASSYTPLSNTSGTLYYYCIVSGTAPCGPSTSSVSGLFTVNPAAGAVTVSPATVTACSNQIITASANPNVNIYWQGTTSNGTSTATQSSSQTVNSSGTYYFRAQTALGCWGPQGSATVTINTPVNITQQPNPTGSQVCSNQPLNALSVSANPNGVTYQWYANAVNSNIGGTPVAGATSPIFTPQNATSGTTYYYCLVNGLTACPNIASNVSPITIYPLPPVDAGNNIAICSGSTIALNATGAPSLTWSGGYQNGVPFIPGSTQMYYVTGVGANQCVKLDSVLITVNSNPIINAGNDITVCSGNAITLNATGALAYSWNNGVVNGAPFIPLVSSVYLVTGTNANGCQGNDMLTVTVNASPQVSGGANQSVCSGNQVILTGTGASTYTWNNNVQNNVPFTPLITQTYTVTGTATNGCTNTAHVTITLLESPNINAGDSMYICNGQEAVLWGSGAEVLTWNPTAVSGVPFIPNSSGYFYLTGYNANGCSAVDSVYIMVSNANYAQPIDLEILGVNVLYAVDSTLDYYQWGYHFNGTSVLTCAGAHYCYFPDFNPAIKEYWLDHGNSGECYRRTYYNQMNTLNETEFDEIKAIPVPFTSYLTIQTDYEQDYLIEIYSVQGELILKCNFYNDSLTLPTDNWNKGTYIIKIHHLSGSNSILVVK